MQGPEVPCLRFNTRFLERIGAWPGAREDARRPGRGWRAFAVGNALLYGFLTVCVANQLRVAEGDVAVATESLEVWATLAAAGHKLMSLAVLQRGRWRALARALAGDGALGRRVTGEGVGEGDDATWARGRLRRCDRLARALSLTLVATATGCVGLLNCKFPLEAALRRAGVLQPLQADARDEWRFPIRMVVPVPGLDAPRGGAAYAAVYATHTLLGGLHVLYIPACDGLLAGLMLHACEHLALLRRRLQGLGRRTGGESAEYVNPRVLKEQMADCVRYHQDILTFLSELDVLCSPLMLSQFFNSALSLCTTAFHVLQSGSDVMKTLSQICFFLGSLVEFGAFCFFADRVKEESEAVGRAAYGGHWGGAGRAHASSLRLVVARSQRAQRLTVGGFVDLSLETYAAVLKGSFTYFTLLREVTE